ncbi:Alpha/Beta hydrolase protein [Scheffersomyces coipomensis]|uniref:Alpha/Beta hydrolase protein n=1 Tax=Scheffersomyces coipomensis TaxID=1788519 RepID=UPI00315D55A8
MAGTEGTSLIVTFVNICILLLKIQSFFLSQLISRFLGIDITIKSSETNLKDRSHNQDILELVKSKGYIVREFVVTTKDGYLLVLHKIERPGRSQYLHNGKIAYFHHGLLTNSELFVLGTKKEKNLPFLLLDLDYEVWLGNNRGNKYSRKHLNLSVCDVKFWDFSLDEYAYYDIPDSLSFIRSFYRPEDKITYIGFSQGCSQLFASLSLKPEVNNYLNLFVGLSPALIPKDLNHPVFKIISNQAAKDNAFLYSLFGRRAIMPSVSFWFEVLGVDMYKKVVDKSLVYLFGWSGKNIDDEQKSLGYPHMFSNSSVKSITHWFQIISSKRFQMFDETGTLGLTRLSGVFDASKSKSHRVTPFPIAHHLNTRMLLFYGDQDILVSIDRAQQLILDHNEKMQNKLEVVLCKGYEHMDTLWGNNVYEDVFSKVVNRMESLHNKKVPFTDDLITPINGSLKKL